MGRYTRIGSVEFDSSPLPLPVSVRVSRRAEPLPASGDNHAFATSVETATPVFSAEVRIRDTSAAEQLDLGQRGDLGFTVRAAEQDKPHRRVTLKGAVLLAVELAYEQTEAADATLRFVAEAETGSQEPFSAGDQP